MNWTCIVVKSRYKNSRGHEYTPTGEIIGPFGSDSAAAEFIEKKLGGRGGPNSASGPSYWKDDANSDTAYQYEIAPLVNPASVK